jgi:predicted hydrolase (HD superfamily)
MLTSPVFTKLWGAELVHETNARTAAVHKKLWGTERKPKVYYACITAEEASELKLRHDDEGYYTRSTKIQAVVKAYKRQVDIREERHGASNQNALIADS